MVAISGIGMRCVGGGGSGVEDALCFSEGPAMLCERMSPL